MLREAFGVCVLSQEGGWSCACRRVYVRRTQLNVCWWYFPVSDTAKYFSVRLLSSWETSTWAMKIAIRWNLEWICQTANCDSCWKSLILIQLVITKRFAERSLNVGNEPFNENLTDRLTLSAQLAAIFGEISNFPPINVLSPDRVVWFLTRSHFLPSKWNGSSSLGSADFDSDNETQLNLKLEKSFHDKIVSRLQLTSPHFLTNVSSSCRLIDLSNYEN